MAESQQNLTDLAPQGRSHAQRWWPLLLLAVLGAAAYANSLRAPFIFDDFVTIEGPDLKRLWPIGDAVRSTPQAPTAGRPVPALSMTVNYVLGGDDVVGYHLFNTIVHVLSFWVLFGIVWRTLRLGRWRANFPGASSTWLALTVAALWLLHPLQTESVVYVTQRTELLMGLFYLLTLYTSIRAWDQPGLWSVTCALCCVLGMASKEVMVSAPIMVVLYDLAFRELGWRELLGRRRRLYAGLACTWVVLALLMFFDPRHNTVGFHLGISIWRCVKTQSWAVMHYLRLAIWPDALCMDYGFWFDVSPGEAVAGIATVVAVVGITLWGWWRHRWLGFLVTWMLLILAPTTSVVPIISEPVAERRMYLPLAALATLAALGAFWVGRRIAQQQPAADAARARVLPTPVAVAILLVVAAYGVQTVQRNTVYASPLSIWQDVVQKLPQSHRGLNNLGDALNRQDRFLEAEPPLRKAVKLSPKYIDALNNLGVALAGLEQYSEAIEYLTQAAKLDPKHVNVHYNLGLAYLRSDRLDDAFAELYQAVEINPRNAWAHYYLAQEYARRHEGHAAVTHFTAALELEPDNGTIHYQYGLLLAKQNKIAPAIAEMRKTAELYPDYFEAKLELYKLLKTADSTAEANRLLDEVLAQGNYLLKHNQLVLAVLLFQGVLNAVPDHEGAQQALQAARSRVNP